MAKRTITTQQWRKLKDETRDTALAILHTCGVIVERTKQPDWINGVEPTICSALYTHAVEEYGKVILLQAHLAVNGFVVIDDAEFRNHKLKFNLALKNLPEQCKILKKGSFSSKSFSDDYSLDTIANQDTRWEVLYTDFDDSGKVKQYPPIDRDKLNEAIEGLKTELFGVDIINKNENISLKESFEL